MIKSYDHYESYQRGEKIKSLHTKCNYNVHHSSKQMEKLLLLSTLKYYKHPKPTDSLWRIFEGDGVLIAIKV
jgi:hypothetical protein